MAVVEHPDNVAEEPEIGVRLASETHSVSASRESGYRRSGQVPVPQGDGDRR